MDETARRTVARPSAATLLASDLEWHANRRQHPRIPARSQRHDEVTIEDADGKKQWSATLLNVSAGGIAASCDRSLIPEGTYGVRFPLPFHGAARMVTARMKVAYCGLHADLSSYRVGFKLLPIGP